MEKVQSQTYLTSHTTLSTKIQKLNFRTDKRGFPILKGSKCHGISFKDQIKQGELQTVILVESWKQLNYDNKQKKQATECCVIY
ncbi:unnamed protein product (macronuclear) [Paramecium tetraurelia]|uniref:Uncharacterized protein n=1 Tax=Paramecium tetraurelia TaxID=5888 RepID=A0BDV9_PARTE|nr:uncharacterized protein GSPATT00027756001 [Paramecium tetraurelia]CAK56726.1 unnamed protein product [Paramecium tetraurelia]|eukprot:XP_001424124.1 hypothetical protein (macronuclear) [Paramecium tetraurelia strain d4-2]